MKKRSLFDPMTEYKQELICRQDCYEPFEPLPNTFIHQHPGIKAERTRSLPGIKSEPGYVLEQTDICAARQQAPLPLLPPHSLQPRWTLRYAALNWQAAARFWRQKRGESKPPAPELKPCGLSYFQMETCMSGGLKVTPCLKKRN